MAPSWNPIELLRTPSGFALAVYAIVVLLIGLVVLVVVLLVRRRTRRSRGLKGRHRLQSGYRRYRG